MRTILAATDFSAAADNACSYAARLAKSFDCTLVVFNAYHRPYCVDRESHLTMTDEEMKRTVNEELVVEAKRLKEKVALNLKIDCKEGHAVTEILSAVEKHNAELLIISARSNGKALRYIFGSLTACISIISKVPIIVVPSGTSFNFVKKIVIAINSDVDPRTDPELTETFLSLSKRYKAQLFLIHVPENLAPELYEISMIPIKQMRKLELPVLSDPLVFNSSFAFESVNNFIHTFNINMLVLFAHKGSLMEKWFFKATDPRNFNMEIPILVIPEATRKQLQNNENSAESIIM